MQLPFVKILRELESVLAFWGEKLKYVLEKSPFFEIINFSEAASSGQRTMLFPAVTEFHKEYCRKRQNFLH